MALQIYNKIIKMIQSKGKGKGKGKINRFEFEAQLNIIHQGALNFSNFISAQIQKGRWLKARILECRLSKDYDTNRKKVQSSYQYYVHYEGINRRMDEWICYSRIRTTNQKVTQQEIKVNKKGPKKGGQYSSYNQHQGMTPATLHAHHQVTKIKTICNIEIGQYQCGTWYYSPYPAPYQHINCLYICEFCLSFYAAENELKRHQAKCPLFHPPGDEIYRDEQNKISVFEIDGKKNPVYCENLCYLSKLYLDHKNLYYDTTPFLFYVLCEYDENQWHITGYFSKQKQSQHNYNLSCILVFPFHQRKGYGKFLISFSYQLSLRDGKLGTPERPLSDLGRASYVSWWTQAIIDYLRKHKGEPICPADISKSTGIVEQDIMFTLEQQEMVKYYEGHMHLCIDERFLDRVYESAGKLGKPLKTDNLRWIPYQTRYYGANVLPI